MVEDRKEMLHLTLALIRQPSGPRNRFTFSQGGIFLQDPGAFFRLPKQHLQRPATNPFW
jgi:hypothetical protein